ncbi:MAG: hypothetical protein ACLSX5_13750 [Lachnospiraceae bacterium]
MKKKWIALALSAALTAVNGMTAFAGQWETAGANWKYKNDDGTYSTNTWQWIDGNNDGVAECYYFDANGYMLVNTTTPDGYTVDGNGAWIVNGTVQTQGMGQGQNQNQNTDAPSSQEIVDYLWHDILERGYHRLVIDTSRPESTSGATNIRYNLNGIDFRNGWVWHPYNIYSGGSSLDCALAFNEEGYLLVNTTTPDGHYVNEYGVMEINGQEVTHNSGCRMAIDLPFSGDTKLKDGTVVTDKNNYDAVNVDQTTTIDLMTYENRIIPFGHLVYMHAFGFGNNDTLEYLTFGTCTDSEMAHYINTAGREVGPQPRDH